MGLTARRFELAVLVACIVAPALPAHVLAADAASAAPTLSEAAAVPQPTPRQLVEKMVATGKSLRSFRGNGKMTVEMKMAGQPTQQTMGIGLAYATGPKFAFTMPIVQLYCDGKKVTTYTPMLNTYTVRDYGPERLQDSLGTLGLGSMAPGKETVETARIVDACMDLLMDSTVKGTETVNGMECWRVDARFVLPGAASGAEEKPDTLPVTIWHRKDDGLPAQLRVDMTEQMKKQMAEMGQMETGMPTIDSLIISVALSSMELNEPLGDETFQFKPPVGATKADSFTEAAGAQAAEPESFSLTGKAAPDFELETFAGRKLKLSELKGKVVLLDFWASWCGPCMAELPHIQTLWEKVKDRPVVIVGVNLDGTKEAAQKAIDELGLTFPIVKDDWQVSDAYEVSGIPCLVIVKPDGTVQGRHVGYRPGIADALLKEIDAALAEPQPAGPAEATGAPSE